VAPPAINAIRTEKRVQTAFLRAGHVHERAARVTRGGRRPVVPAARRRCTSVVVAGPERRRDERLLTSRGAVSMHALSRGAPRTAELPVSSRGGINERHDARRGAAHSELVEVSSGPQLDSSGDDRFEQRSRRSGLAQPQAHSTVGTECQRETPSATKFAQSLGCTLPGTEQDAYEVVTHGDDGLQVGGPAVRGQTVQLSDGRQLVRETRLRPGVEQCKQQSAIRSLRGDVVHVIIVTRKIECVRYVNAMHNNSGRVGRSFWVWLGVASLVRSPVLMSAVAFSAIAALVLQNPDRGGLLAAASVVGMLAGTPASIVAQRLLSTRRLLTIQLLLCSGSWLALAFSLDRPFGLWMAISAVAGSSMAGSAGLVRSTLSAAVPARKQARASTLDALAQDVLVFLAPVFVAVALSAGAVGAPVAVSVLALAAVIGVQFQTTDSASTPSGEHALDDAVGATPRPSFHWFTWTCFSVGVGMLLGAVEAGAVGLSLRLGLEVQDAWLAFLALGASSAVGAWLDIIWLQRWHPSRRLPLLIAVFLAGAVLLTFEPQWLTALAGLLLVGLPTAALLGLRSHVFDSGAAAHRKTGLTLAFAGQSIGFAVGAAGLALSGRSGALVVAGSVVAAGGLLGTIELRRQPGGRRAGRAPRGSTP